MPQGQDKFTGKSAIDPNRSKYFTCKSSNALALTKELEITMRNINNNKIYEIINTTNKNDVIDKHKRFRMDMGCKQIMKINVCFKSTGDQNSIRIPKKHGL